jgi:hypothetical protein
VPRPQVIHAADPKRVPVDIADVQRVLTPRTQTFHQDGDADPALLELIGAFIAGSFDVVLSPTSWGTGGDGCVVDDRHIRFSGITAVTGTFVAQAQIEWELRPLDRVPHAHLEWIRKLPGQPSVRVHLRQGLSTVEASGFEAIWLEAGLRSGPTYWAEAGFDFRDHATILHANEVADNLAGVYGVGRDRFATAYDMWAHREESASIRSAFATSRLIDPNFTHPGQLSWMANSPAHKVDVDADIPIGHAILYALSPWLGHLELSDATAVATYRAFL